VAWTVTAVVECGLCDLDNSIRAEDFGCWTEKHTPISTSIMQIILVSQILVQGMICRVGYPVFLLGIKLSVQILCTGSHICAMPLRAIHAEDFEARNMTFDPDAPLYPHSRISYLCMIVSKNCFQVGISHTAKNRGKRSCGEGKRRFEKIATHICERKTVRFTP
jgi:hypothetical protein